MLHAQWGKLFMGFALARVGTYVILFLQPAKSTRPQQRPPTEIIASFCLMTGGMILMLSNKDTVQALNHNLLDAMFLFDIATSFMLVLMAWIAMCLSIKGWAQRQETDHRKWKDEMR